MPNIFLDESGQFTKHNDEAYFVVASFTIGDPKRTAKQFRVWQKTKFPKRMRNQAEIKFSEVKITDELRLKTLKFFSDLDIRINFVYLKKDNISDDFKRKEKIKSGELYVHIIGELLRMYLPINDLEFRVFCDQRHLKGITRAEFKKTLKVSLMPLLPKNTIIQIEMIDSTSNENIQIADWVAGAIKCYLESGRLGGEFWKTLKNNILSDGGRELFEDYWKNKFSKQKTQSND